MANELTYQIQSALSNDGLTDNFSSGSVAVDQTNRRMVKDVQEIAIAAAGEAIGLGALVSIGFAVFKNLDDTNFVEVGRSIGGSFEAFAKLKPGEVGFLRLAAGIAPYARADTAACELMYTIYDD